MTIPPRSPLDSPPTAVRPPLEPRFFARAAVDVPVALELEDRSVAGRTVNVSEGGMLAQLGESVPAGSFALLELELPGAAAATAAIVEIVWCRREGPPARPYVVGLALVEVDDATVEAIRQYVERCEPLFWE